MAGRERQDWFEREEFIGQISDIRVQNLQVEREAVQKRTFTRWMNLHLQKCDPPIQIQDLFRDIQDGFILMVLLEELSGCKLIHGFKKSSHRIFRLNNIAKVLAFLEERNVKLVSIDATDVADGNSSIILGLIWNIILFFQIKELTGNIRSQFPSCSSLSSIPTSSDSDTSHSSTPSEERRNASSALKENSKAIRKLLQWIQRKTRKYGVAVQDFGRSWTSGLAFLALIKSIDSSLVDMRKALLRSPRENLEDAFRIAHYSLGIPRLLEPEDVGFNEPDEQSIIMYVSQFLEHFPGLEEAEESTRLIERSVSMGRLNDANLMRNGAHLGRVKERTSLFQRDCGKPPPKILLSSVSEDRDVLSPRLRVAATRSWSSDDILSDPPCDVVSKISQQVADVQPDLSCTAPSFTPDSGHPEPLIPDSAIHSPDSWMESELMPESHSDCSLFDGPGWDVYRATPVQVLPVDEGFMSPMADRAPDEPSVTGSYSDEGVSSMESTQDKAQQEEKDKELNSENLVLELITDPGDGDTSKEIDSNHISPLHQELSWTTNEEVTLFKDGQTNNLTPDFSIDHEESSQREQEGETDGPFEEPESITSEEAISSRYDEGLDSKNEPLNVSNEGRKTEEEKPLDEEICTYGTILPNQEETSKTGLIIPIISISSGSKEYDEESEQEDWETNENLDKKTESGNGGDDTEPNSPTSPVPLEHVVLVPVCSEDLKEEKPESSETKLQQPTADEQLSDETSSVTESVQNQEVDEPKLEDSSDDSVVVKESQVSQVNLDSEVFPAGSEVGYASIMDTLDLTEPTVPPSSGPSGFNRTTNFFYSEFDESSPTVAAPVEPMDLFYPDNEEPILSEPADTEMQRWPSVLSVSALEPAPTSVDDTDDQLLMGEEDDNELIPSNQEPADGLSTREQCDVPLWESRADIPADIRDSERRGSSGGTDEIQIPSGLRRRKGPHLVQSGGENQGAALRTAEREDTWWTENRAVSLLLLLLWLLLYCLLLLPQVELQELPALLLDPH